MDHLPAPMQRCLAGYGQNCLFGSQKEEKLLTIDFSLNINYSDIIIFPSIGTSWGLSDFLFVAGSATVSQPDA
ncbi:MAG: hypothetical protein JSW39_08165 [Desulfobacterales bacterium]|nr:MAG: hypothetical protein JSW39_08165 [Desulfobacterales bacterium]